ncbi:MAG TPA: amidohydrolase family protein [Longimicrobium sp.]|nr:amidohydrolase family protein [Longimicrobium sp.]
MKTIRLCASLVTILALATAAAAQPRPQLADSVRRFVAVDAPVVALTHVRLVDGTGAPARNDQTVIVRGTRIEAAGPSASTRVPAGARVLDLSGHTVIPGLVSLHEHTYFGGLGQTMPMNASAYLYLAFGVTTAMTAGSQLPEQELALKRAIDAGHMPGPRLLIAGPYITAGTRRTGGFCGIDSAEEARRFVDEWAGNGATWFKVMSGPGNVLRWVIDAAHARGLRVTGHLCAVTFTEAAEMGIDALQHGFITNSEYVPGKQPDVCPPGNQRAQADVDVTSEAVRESIRRIAARGTPVVSTLGVYESFIPGRPLDPRAMEMLAPDTRRAVEAYHASMATQSFNVPERLLTKMMQWERMFVAAGGLLGAGSDPWGTGFLPGYGNLRNYELLVQAGFTPEQAIQIFTLNGARILGEEARIGSIAAGKNADLVVIRGDPVATPSQVYEVATVFRDGVGYDAGRLRDFARGKIGAAAQPSAATSAAATSASGTQAAGIPAGRYQCQISEEYRFRPCTVTIGAGGATTIDIPGGLLPSARRSGSTATPWSSTALRPNLTRTVAMP